MRVEINRRSLHPSSNLQGATPLSPCHPDRSGGICSRCG